MANVSFHIGSSFPTNRVDGGIYVNHHDSQLYIVTSENTSVFDGARVVDGAIPGNLELSTWAGISVVSMAGDASKYWKVGDTKNVTLTTGTVLTFAILDFDHDMNSGITFGMVDCLPTTYELTDGSATRPQDALNMYINATVLSNYFLQLPLDLQNVIVTTIKNSVWNGISWGNKYKLFLLSATEVGGSEFRLDSGDQLHEGTQYLYYKQNANRRLKKCGTDYCRWWTRTQNDEDNATGQDFHAYGNNMSFVSTPFVGSNKLGISFAFCV